MQIMNFRAENTSNISKPSSKSKTPKKENKKLYAILLTTYNEKSRTEMYLKRINWWIENSDLDIYIVDSSNNGFPTIKSDRVKICKFDQNKYIKNLTSTTGELISMDQCAKKFKNDFKKYKYIIKITGKYILPDLDSYIKNSVSNKSNYDFILQNNKNGIFQNTECIGFRASKFGKIIKNLQKRLNEDDNVNILEHLIGLYVKENNAKAVRLKPLHIPEDYRVPRGAGDVLPELFTI